MKREKSVKASEMKLEIQIYPVIEKKNEKLPQS